MQLPAGSSNEPSQAIPRIIDDSHSSASGSGIGSFYRHFPTHTSDVSAMNEHVFDTDTFTDLGKSRPHPRKASREIQRTRCPSHRERGVSRQE
jgi:hypothetical protein